MTAMKSRSVRSSLLAIYFVTALFVVQFLAEADGYGFSPPNGWVAQRPPAGYAGLWLNPLRSEAVNLATVPAYSLSGLASHELGVDRSLYPSIHVYNNAQFRVCGRHDARYLIWTSSSHGKVWVHEQLLSVWGATGYVASYVRPSAFAPSRSARSSIISICAVPGADISNPAGAGGIAPANQPPPANGGAGGEETAPPSPSAYPTITPRYAPIIPM